MRFYIQITKSVIHILLTRLISLIKQANNLPQITEVFVSLSFQVKSPPLPAILCRALSKPANAVLP